MKRHLKQGIGCALRQPECPRIANPRYSRLPVGATPYGFQQGIALVITLIMLSVITFMAVTFLVVSRHEAEAVTTTTDQNVSKFAADASLQMAEGQIAAILMGNANGYNFPYFVSTNYVSPGGYDPNAAGSPFDVNYYYIPSINNGGPLSQADQLRMLTNLLFLPRAPVFIVTNKNQLNPEFRFYVDENGNGIYDTNGWVTETPIGGGAPVVNYYSGDPEWIGFLEHPEQRHSPTNQFLARGAFIAQPIGNSLDINYIHSQTKFLVNNTLTEGFFRNEGMGSWEENLAAFLQSLNTNVWGAQLPINNPNYLYNTNLNFANQGTAFYDASEIMRYRYNGSYLNLNSFQGLYGQTAAGYFDNDYLDGYTAGILLTNTGLPAIDFDTRYSKNSWSGADNPLQFVRPRDLYNLVPPVPASATPSGVSSFTNNLYQAGIMYDPNPPSGTPPSVTNSYNRYTLYRLLSEMGMGSAPEPAPYPVGGGTNITVSGIIPGVPPATLLPPNVPAGRYQMSYGSAPEPFPYPNGRKMNLNYVSVGGTNATNYIPWTPVGFFTNAADRLLRSYFPTNFAFVANGQVIVTNLNINFIPIYPVNYYTPAVHRMLQLAANMYDAGTNKTYTINPLTGTVTFNQYPNNIDYPSVFKPYFRYLGSVSSPIIYISGYGEQSAPAANDPIWNAPWDLRRPNDLNQLLTRIRRLSGLWGDTNENVYGVPYVVGARAGFPNFNQFSTAPVVQINRLMQLTRASSTTPVSLYKTNVAYTIGISNVVGVQCWNSYTNSFNRLPQGIRILVTNDFSMVVTNTLNTTAIPINYTFGNQFEPGFFSINPWTNGVANNGTYVTTSFAVPMLTNAIALPTNASLLANGLYSTNGSVFLPLTSNRLTGSYYPDWGISVTNRVRVIIQDIATGRVLDYVQLGGLGQLGGIDSQDGVISNLNNMAVPPGANVWATNLVSATLPFPAGLYNQYAISLGAITVSPTYWASAPSGANPSSIQAAIQGFRNWLTGVDPSNQKQLPFPATMTIAKVYTWSANDPLVHYTVGDLTDLTQNSTNLPVSVSGSTNVLSKLTGISSRYRPWNNTGGLNANMSAMTQDYIEYLDPQMTGSSAWQFPNNKYPNVGWLGRVHRGTPWQTVYMKPHAANFNATAWQYWTGNANQTDALTAQPMSDWQMFDLFTTAPNDNASRGQLPVNQTGTAAWAAVLDSVMVLANNIIPGKLVATNIDTTQPNGPGQTIINAINAYRATTNVPNQAFTSLGQLFGASALTTGSPYITLNNNDPNLTDAVYERIPQQIASLLRVGTPRYAIYAYGQSLKPANGSIYQGSGPYFGMCTNYQITGEVLTRTIVRFDNMPIPGYPRPGSSYTNALPIVNAPTGTPEYVNVVYKMPLMKAVAESFEVLGPDQ